jgi:hypothetical protein
MKLPVLMGQGDGPRGLSAIGYVPSLGSEPKQAPWGSLLAALDRRHRVCLSMSKYSVLFRT